MASGSKFVAKGAGMAKGVSKALEGYPGIFHHLAGEHAEVSSLMQRVAVSADDSSARERIFPEIRKNLLAHARAEEKEFYTPLRRFGEVEALVSRAEAEHDRIEQYLEQLSSGNKNTKTWLQVFERMQRAVKAHVEMEENELFPMAKELIDRGRADQMLERYERTEEREKSRL